MTVKELIDILQILPQNYEVTYDAYDCGCLEGVNDVELKVKDKVVILKKYYNNSDYNKNNVCLTR